MIYGILFCLLLGTLTGAVIKGIIDSKKEEKRVIKELVDGLDYLKEIHVTDLQSTKLQVRPDVYPKPHNLKKRGE